ncbi:PREDICTED: collagen alpha-3(VI) chain-like [Branchiostoma belcheri]|uniref:Collagen alpha-3(VI) chain-like n=1 Tax=Branchiostoma belcheri TaxID=7741 RepID=A0A6P4YS65_BRABE|nr:PREDICTED: collagen alpha-3(VI) chain-like [Branchiostoma belcheri]
MQGTVDIVSLRVTQILPGSTATTTTVDVEVVTTASQVSSVQGRLTNITAPGQILGGATVISSQVALTAPVCSVRVDLVFVLDGTGSVGADNFERMKTFVQKMISDFEIGSEATRIGVVVYSHRAELAISLDAFEDGGALQDAVAAIAYPGGYTRTGAAIDYTTTSAFSTRNGAREGVVRVAIILTDGISYDDPSEPAQSMRKAAIITYAVGIGSNLDRDQLDVIAGVPENLMMLDNFSMLDNLRTTLPGRVCAGATSEQILIRILITSTRFDVSLLNANSTAFQTILYQINTAFLGYFPGVPGFTAPLVSLAPGPTGDSVVAMCLGWVPAFASNTVRSGLLTAPAQLNNLTIDTTFTSVVAARTSVVFARLVVNVNYTAEYQVRGSAAYDALILRLQYQVLNQFSAMQGTVDIVSLRVTQILPGSTATTTTVDVEVVTTASQVSSVQGRLTNITAPGQILGGATVISSQVALTAPVCNVRVDLVFVLDGTGSVGADNFERMKTFVQKMISDFEIGPEATRIGVVVYSHRAVLALRLDAFEDEGALQDAIAAIAYPGGYTLTGAAIDYTTMFAFSTRNGAREGVIRVAIILTDGISFDDVANPAQSMRKAAIITYAVGIGSNLDRDQLDIISGSRRNLFMLDDFSKLEDLRTQLPSRVCDVGSSVVSIVSLVVTSQEYRLELLDANSTLTFGLIAEIQFALNAISDTTQGLLTWQSICFLPGPFGAVAVSLQLAAQPFAVNTIETTIATLTSLGSLQINPSLTTITDGATRRSIIITLELHLTYTVEFGDVSSVSYTNLSVILENGLLQKFTDSPADIQSVSITSVAPGPTATTTSVTVSVVTLGANVDATTQIIVNTTAPGARIGPLPVVSSTVGDTTPPCSAVADIVFVVDGTGSVGLENFERMKTFISQLLAFLDIGENAVRVSIVQYAVQARTEFFLDQYFDLQALQDAVEAIQYMGGYTKTGNAIDFATNVHFDVRNGARATVTKIVVVITDGISQDDVQRPARRMHQAGIVTIAVGVGSNLDSDQLLAIAGDPNTLLSLDDFDRLQDLTTTLPSMLCDVGTSQQIVVSICVTTTYDVLILNANSSVSTALFQQVVQGLTTTVTSSPGIAALQPIGFAPGCGGVVSTVQCAVAPFALDTVQTTFQDLQPDFGDLTIDPGQTTVVSADTRTTIIVTVELTLTYIEDYQDTSSTAYVDLGVTIEDAVLQAVTTTPADVQSVSHYFSGSWNDRNKHIGDCECSGARCKCRRHHPAVADIVFVWTALAASGLENFERMKTFISQLLAFLDIGENAVRVSIVQYAVQARTEFFLDQYFDLQALQDAVEAIQYMGGYTKTGNAIDFATNVHFDVRNGARATVTKIVVVITDGISQDDVQRPARRMRQAGIVTIAVGVGSNLDSDQLLAIAGDPNTLLSLDDFDRLQDLTTTLPSMLCDVDDHRTSSPGIAALQPIGFAPGCGGVVSTVQCAVAPFALDTVQTTFQNLQPDFGDLTIDPGQTTVVSADTRTTIIVTVELTLTYTEDYQDTSSTAYVNLGVTIEDAVLQAFSTTPADVQSVSITSVAPGTTATSTSVTVSVVALGANVDATTQIIINTTAPGTQLGNLPVVSSSVGDTTPPCSAVLDLVFVLDGTGSVGEENFERIKAIVQKLVTNFNIGAGQTRVGIIQYANIQQMEISLDAYSDVDSLVEAIGNIGYIGGNTLTGQALDYTWKFGFSPNNGARTGVVQVAIVITDGVSDDEVSNPAQRMRKAQIVTYAVGIGSNLDNDQLLSIAGTAGNVVMLSDFNRLTDLATTLPQQVCEVGRGVQLFIGLSVPSVTFDDNLLNADSSAYVTLVQQVNSGVTQTLGQIAGLNVIQVINFVPVDTGVVVYCQASAGLWASDSVTQSIVSLTASFGPLTIDPAATEVAPLDAVNLYVSMEIQQAFSGELMNPSSADFQTLSTSLQINTFNTIQGALSVSIIQFSAGSTATTTYVVLLIVVKTSVQTTFIQNFDTAIQSGSYGTLTVVSGSIAITEPPCPNELDIIFVLDGSGSVGSDNFEKIKTFVSKTVARFNIGLTETQFGVIQYNTQPHSEILLNDHQDAASLQQAISDIRYLQGGTNTGQALRYLANNAFSTKNGARAGVSKMAIVVTDGQSADDVVRPALNAGKEGIVLYAVGIGGEVDYQELRDIASSADKVFNVTDFSGLQSIGNTLPDQVCQTGVEVFVQIPITSQTFTGELLNPLSVEYTSFSAVIAGWATTTLQSVSGFQSYQIVAIRPS